MRLLECGVRARIHNTCALAYHARVAISVKSSALVLLLLGTALLCACRDMPSAALRIGLQSAPLTLDPRYATDAVATRINRLLYRRLVEFNARAEPIPGIAHWQQLDPRHYVFWLDQEGRTFSDGTSLRASDVKATYDYILDPVNASPLRSTLAIIDRIDATNPDRLDVYLKRDDILFPGYLVVGILPARLIATHHDFAHAPIGSGPCRFIAWPSDDRLRLQRRSDGVTIEFLRVADPTVRVLKLLRGEIDLLQNDLPPELSRYLAQRPGITVQHRRGSAFSYLGFNLQDPVLAQPAVRTAIALGINRELIVRRLLQGEAHTANALLPPEHWAGNPQLRAYPYDPVRARALLATLGYGPQHPLPLDCSLSNDPLRLRLATVLQSQLAAIGVALHLKSYDWGTFYGDIKAGRFQLYSLSWVGIKTPDVFRYAFFSRSAPPAGANRGHYNDPRADKLIEQAEAAPDLRTQATLYQALQARLLETLPAVPLWYEDQVLAVRNTVRGYALDGDGDYDGVLTAVKQRAVNGR